MNKSKVLGYKPYNLNVVAWSFDGWSVSLLLLFGRKQTSGEINQFGKHRYIGLQYHQFRDSKMEGGDWTQDLGSVSLMPDSALCAEDRVNRVLLKYN